MRSVAISKPSGVLLSLLLFFLVSGCTLQQPAPSGSLVAEQPETAAPVEISIPEPVYISTSAPLSYDVSDETDALIRSLEEDVSAWCPMESSTGNDGVQRLPRGIQEIKVGSRIVSLCVVDGYINDEKAFTQQFNADGSVQRTVLYFSSGQISTISESWEEGGLSCYREIDGAGAVQTETDCSG